MSHTQEEKTFAVEEAVRAQKALRELAGLGPQMFSIQAFVGMISDEVETLRNHGHTDEDIALTIKTSSNSSVSAADIAAYYASSEERHRAHL